MSQQRIVKNEIWDDEWFYDLEPIEKLIWLFLLTNVRCNIAGIYKLNVKWAAGTVGVDQDVLEKTLDKFVDNEKVYRDNEWIVLINFVKHQAKNPSVIKGIERVLEDIPSRIVENLRQAVPDCPTLLYSTLLYPTLRESAASIDRTTHTPDGKQRFGEFKNVFLSDEEREKLKDIYGTATAKNYVERLSTYIASKKQDPYRSHYATIRQWMRRDGVVVDKKPVQPSMEPEKPLSKEDQERLARKRAEITKSLTMKKK